MAWHKSCHQWQITFLCLAQQRYIINQRISYARKVTITNLSQARRSQLAIIHRDSINTRRTVPGHMVISVFNTNLVSKLILFKAPMLREDASVNNLLCNNITLQIRYRRRYIGIESTISTGTTVCWASRWSVFGVVHTKVKLPGMGCTAHMTISTVSWIVLLQEIAILQSSTQLSTANNWKKNTTYYKYAWIMNNGHCYMNTTSILIRTVYHRK